MIPIDDFISMYSTSIETEYCEGLNGRKITVIIIIRQSIRLSR